MSKELLGDACAFIAAKERGGKNRYPKIGTAFKDSTDGRISIKIDALPIAGDNWQGWINIFPPRERTAKPKMPGDDKPYGTVMGDGLEDDIPF